MIIRWYRAFGFLTFLSSRRILSLLIGITLVVCLPRIDINYLVFLPSATADSIILDIEISVYHRSSLVSILDTIKKRK